DGAALDSLVVESRRARAHRIEQAVVDPAVAPVTFRKFSSLGFAGQRIDAFARSGRLGFPVVLLARWTILRGLDGLLIDLGKTLPQLGNLVLGELSPGVDVGELGVEEAVVDLALAGG